MSGLERVRNWVFYVFTFSFAFVLPVANLWVGYIFPTILFKYITGEFDWCCLSRSLELKLFTLFFVFLLIYINFRRSSDSFDRISVAPPGRLSLSCRLFQTKILDLLLHRRCVLKEEKKFRWGCIVRIVLYRPSSSARGWCCQRAAVCLRIERWTSCWQSSWCSSLL